MDKVEKYMNEASTIHFTKLEKEKQELMKKIIPNPEKMLYFDGIHGTIAQLHGFGGVDSYRFDKNDIKKLLQKDIRWIEVRSIGF